MTDETRVYHFTPESKQQPLEWRYSRSPKKESWKWRSLLEKSWTLLFGTGKKFFWLSLCQLGQPSMQLCIVRFWKNFATIQNRRQGMLMKRVCLLHDNVRLHVARYTKGLSEKFGWDVISHPPLAQFFNLKKHLGGKRLDGWRSEAVFTSVSHPISK